VLSNTDTERGNEIHLSNLKSVETNNGLGTDYWKTNGDDDEYYWEFMFTYYPDLESYEYEDVYQEDEFPMIEMDTYLYDDLLSLFNEKIITNKSIKLVE